MNWTETLGTHRAMLAEGAVIERLRRNPTVKLDPLIGNSALLFDSRGRAALAAIYREYVAIAAEHDLPLVLCTPTWRANPERVRLASSHSCAQVNREAAAFMEEIRAAGGLFAGKIFVAGLMGCRGDAYAPREGLTDERACLFHSSQATALAAGGVDLLLAATLPAIDEAVGLARAMAATALPYVLSFVLRPSGTLLDGTALRHAVQRIDVEVDPPPACYWANCTHPSVFSAAMRAQCLHDPVLPKRVAGLQANASPLSPEELDESPRVLAGDPAALADLMIGVHREFGTKILGGCCGTDGAYIRALAAQMREI
ncbi:MAG: homocysteine S-methyltransferase family protein [Candidatus Eisenbacteria bacterium]